MLKRQFFLCFCIVVALTAFVPGLGSRPVVAAEKTVTIQEEDVQVLTSGPIHEAFAGAVALDPEPGIVAPKAPPALIEEILSDQKPEGDVQWIPGYWAWDDERTEYIWVSGTWRVPPPGRQWICGYWNRTTQGYQWISGYWASVKEKVTEYLPEPPESVEVGPSSNAPSPDYIWIPGCWLWRYGRYAWRPGYWAAVHPDWIWVPAHYTWTPRGYIFVSGYWDYTVIHRGILFAPVFFRRGCTLG
ncbi:MAG: YXWGXW repeat-containing protein [Syntrophaceae bacterium]|nr:YXWGXW repeat-containing protein [Syntrophaceae bacterium]